MNDPTSPSTTDGAASIELVDAIAGRAHELAADGAGLEETIAALLRYPHVSLDLLAAVHLHCMGRRGEDLAWKRAATMVAAAMRTGLFHLER